MINARLLVWRGLFVLPVIIAPMVAISAEVQFVNQNLKGRHAYVIFAKSDNIRLMRVLAKPIDKMPRSFSIDFKSVVLPTDNKWSMYQLLHSVDEPKSLNISCEYKQTAEPSRRVSAALATSRKPISRKQASKFAKQHGSKLFVLPSVFERGRDADLLFAFYVKDNIYGRLDVIKQGNTKPAHSVDWQRFKRNPHPIHWRRVSVARGEFRAYLSCEYDDGGKEKEDHDVDFTWYASFEIIE